MNRRVGSGGAYGGGGGEIRKCGEGICSPGLAECCARLRQAASVKPCGWSRTRIAAAKLCLSGLPAPKLGMFALSVISIRRSSCVGRYVELASKMNKYLKPKVSRIEKIVVAHHAGQIFIPTVFKYTEEGKASGLTPFTCRSPPFILNILTCYVVMSSPTTSLVRTEHQHCTHFTISL